MSIFELLNFKDVNRHNQIILKLFYVHNIFILGMPITEYIYYSFSLNNDISHKEWFLKKK